MCIAYLKGNFHIRIFCDFMISKFGFYRIFEFDRFKRRMQFALQANTCLKIPSYNCMDAVLKGKRDFSCIRGDMQFFDHLCRKICVNLFLKEKEIFFFYIFPTHDGVGQFFHLERKTVTDRQTDHLRSRTDLTSKSFLEGKEDFISFFLHTME